MSTDEYPDQLLRRESPPRQSAWVRASLAQGRLRPMLLVGHAAGVAALHQQLLRQQGRTYRVVGCCLPAPGRVGETYDGLPVLGGPDDVVDVVRRHEVDTVAVLLSSGLDSAALSRLERDLEPTRAELLLAPAATGAAGSDRPVGRTEASHQGRPRLHGVDGLVKTSFDRAAAALLLVVLAPVLLGVAVHVAASSRGPVFVRELRVGRGGRLFHLLRFRTTGPPRRLDQAPLPDGDRRPGSRRDPWEPRLGPPLRRFAIDELPALLNVLMGDMSLVGPRPRLPSATPGPAAGLDRQLTVRPGLIAPRHVRGRYRDDRRVDPEYAEHWSLLLDLRILGAACAAVLRGRRAP